MLVLALIRLPAGDLADFEAYESAVLPLLAAHGGALTMRVRSLDQTVEAHLLTFEDKAAFEAFRSDPARAALRGLWDRSSATSETWTVVSLL